MEPDRRFKHEHRWTFGTHLVLNVPGAIPEAPQRQVPTVVFTCECGRVWLRPIPPMSEEPPK